MAGKSQIAGVVSPAVLPRDDVLNVMRNGGPVLRKEAIFATVPGPPADEFPRSRIHSLFGVGKLTARL
jgi:hypothetical protein